MHKTIITIIIIVIIIIVTQLSIIIKLLIIIGTETLEQNSNIRAKLIFISKYFRCCDLTLENMQYYEKKKT